jgi:hypothetical protein
MDRACGTNGGEEEHVYGQGMWYEWGRRGTRIGCWCERQGEETPKKPKIYLGA